MKRIVILTFLSALFCVSLSAQTTVDDIKKKYNEGAEFTNSRDFAAAIKAFEEVLTMGETVEEAGETIEQAQKILPQVYIMQGNAFASQKDFDSALGLFAKAAERAELNGDVMNMNKAKGMTSKVYMVLGVTHFNNKEYDKALEYFTKGYEVNPNDTRLALYRARSFAEAGRMEEAIEAYKQIIDLGKRHDKYAKDAADANAELTSNMMMALANAAKDGNYDDVVKYSDVIASFSPKHPQALMIKLQAANNAKKYKEVSTFGEEVAEVQTDANSKSEAWFLVGSAYDNLEMNEKAVAAYKNVVAGPMADTAKSQAEVITKKLEEEAAKK